MEIGVNEGLLREGKLQQCTESLRRVDEGSGKCRGIGKGNLVYEGLEGTEDRRYRRAF